MQRWRLPQRLMHQEVKPRKSVYQEPVHTYPPHPNIRTVSQFVWAPCDGDWKWLPFCGEEKYMYPLSLRVGDRGVQTSSLPYLACVQPLPPFKKKSLLTSPPPAVSPSTLSHLTLFPPPSPRTLVLFHTLHKNVYALFKEGALLKIYINRLW